MRISAVQFLVLKDADKNIAKAKEFIKAESGRSELIVFPELFLNCKHPDHSPYLVKTFCKLSRDYKIDIVPGSMLTKRKGKVYNTSYYISKGKVVAKYDKASLWRSEVITAGALPKPFKTRFGKTALIICWDLASPEIALRLSKLNLDLIICPSMWWKGSESGFKPGFTDGMIDALCLTRAYESRAVVVYANAAGKLRLGRFSDLSAGRSQIVVPMAVSEVAKGSVEQTIKAAIDPDTLIHAKRYLGRP